MGARARSEPIPAAAARSRSRRPEPGFDPLDVVLGMQAHQRTAAARAAEPLSAAMPSHAITLQGSALFHTGDRQRVHAAVEGELDDGVCAARSCWSYLRAAGRATTRTGIWLCDLTVVAMEGVTPRGPGLLLRRRTSGGGARVALPDGYVPLTLESAELDELYDVRIASGCDEVAAREALTPADDRLAVRACARGAGGRDRRRQRPARDGGDALLGRGARCVQPPTPAGSRTPSSTTRRAQAQAALRPQIQRRRRRNATDADGHGELQQRAQHEAAVERGRRAAP